MLSAPIIHARTKNNDFPSKLLVVPDDFSTSDVFWAKKYISDSTRYFELSGKEGRRVIFCNEEQMVSGISIRIGDLYRACGREVKYAYVDGSRINYAFIGVVIHKREVLESIEIPLEYLLDIYERYMEMLWDKPYEEKGMEAARAAYEPYDFPEAKEECSIPVMDKGRPKLVIDDKFASLDCVMAAVTGQMRSLSEYAFCSNMPNATSVTESDFFVVTSPNAKGIIEVMKKKEEKARLEEEARLEEKAKAKEGHHGEEGMDVNRKKKSRFSELMKIGEELRGTWKGIPYRTKSGPVPKEHELRDTWKGIKSPKLKNSQEIGNEPEEWSRESQGAEQKDQGVKESREIKENQTEGKITMKAVFGGVVMFFGALWVLISAKKEEQDSLEE